MIEQQIQRGQQWLEDLLTLIGAPAEVKVGEVSVEPTDFKNCWLVVNEINLTPAQIDTLIGEQGEAIDAIQYLTNTLLNLGIELEDQCAFTVELNGYRLKRQEELLAWVQDVAQQVRQTGQEMEMKSLSSAERRQIHTYLKDAQDLETESRGQEPDRRLVVRLR